MKKESITTGAAVGVGLLIGVPVILFVLINLLENVDPSLEIPLIVGFYTIITIGVVYGLYRYIQKSSDPKKYRNLYIMLAGIVIFILWCLS